MEGYIAGTVSSSITNWPGKTSLVVQFAGCNFRCPYCYSSDFLDTKEEFKVLLKDIKREIKENKPFVDIVFFGGAEPCLQRQSLLELADYAKKMNIKVGLETNGSKPELIEELIKKRLLDHISVDLKAPLNENFLRKIIKSETFFQNTMDIVDDIKKTLNILKENENRLEIEIRTTIVPGLVYRKEDVLEIAKELKNLKCRWRLQQFRPDLSTIVDKKFKNIKPPTKEFLLGLKETCQKAYPGLRVSVDA